MSIEIKMIGSWLYDGVAETQVDIVSLPYDWWYCMAKAEDSLEPNEKPEPLNDIGVLYYVRFRNSGELTEPTWVDSAGYKTIKEAIVAAESKVPGSINWREN